MRLLSLSDAGHISLAEFPADKVPPYGILSHTWGDEEVLFKDLENDTGNSKAGYDKIRFCGEQASRDGLHYFWVDTCCIDKSSSAELQEAINCMFRWYRNAAQCYVHLADVSTPNPTSVSNELSWEPAFRDSRWFSRGWTLQELIAPASAKFFSREGVQLGTKQSLEHHIHAVTGIPIPVLRGNPLSDFSIATRMAWMQNRQTTREEDRAYSLLGIFDVHMPLLYGEREGNALRRLQEEIAKASKAQTDEDHCLTDLRSTDPRHDKIRIEDTKGGLLRDSYRWVLDTVEFKQWLADQGSRILWIKGDPGKGKTMLLCGIIDELKGRIGEDDALSFFFCQATDSRINSAVAVLRGLIYLLVVQQPSLNAHIQPEYDHAGKKLFEDANAFVALSEILTNMLKDPDLQTTYLVVDALDECERDLPKLLDIIIQTLSLPRVKWIVSSRNIPDIERQLKLDQSQQLSLETKANSGHISRAVDSYVQHCISQLPSLQDDGDLLAKVRDTIQQKAHGTFLWVSLVVRELKGASNWDMEEIVDGMPSDLEKVYDRMLRQIQQLNRQNPHLCQLVLLATTIAYCPLRLCEIGVLSGLPPQIAGKLQSVQRVISLCGSFLTIREGTVYIIHQSAKDFLSSKVASSFFPLEAEQAHHGLFSRSLNTLSQILERDIYTLKHPGTLIDRVKDPDFDPLAAAKYACVYWVDHLEACGRLRDVELEDGGPVDHFLCSRYLFWLEALSLLKSLPDGVRSMAKLEALLQGQKSHLCDLVEDARRFVQYHKSVIENSPLQVYASALLFTPTHTITRALFQGEEPNWVRTKPHMEDKWSACTQTLEAHNGAVRSIAFSSDGKLLASAADDHTIRLWDIATGACVQTFEGHNGAVRAVAFSPDGHTLVSTADDVAWLWDVVSGQLLQTFDGQMGAVRAVAYSPDGRTIATGNDAAQLWDIASGVCVYTLKHYSLVRSVAFSPDSTILATAAHNSTVRLWNVVTGECIQTLAAGDGVVRSVAFSPDGHTLASAADGTVRLWDTATGLCKQTIKGYRGAVWSLAFSPDGRILAIAADHGMVRLWDMGANSHIQTFEGHIGAVRSVMFSPDGSRLASAAYDRTIRLWDTATAKRIQSLEAHGGAVWLVVFSPDKRLLASAADDDAIRLWDVATGECVQVLEGHIGAVWSLAFSPDGRIIAAADDDTVRFWDLSSYTCIRTIDTATTVHHLEFDCSGSCLNTDIGRIRLSSSFNILQTAKAPQQPHHQGYSVSIDRVWITWNTENVLWLPPECRPSCSAVADATVAIGCSSGRVLIIGFSGSRPGAFWR